jgi:hypothetical protein
MYKSLRYVRTTWTAFCLIACLLLCVLWIRSYWWVDGAGRNLASNGVALTSQNGLIVASWFNGRNGNFINSRKDDVPADMRSLLETYLDRHRDYVAAIFPHWLVALVVAVVGFLPWLRRFRTRTLLIMTTAVAALLGLLAYFNHW